MSGITMKLTGVDEVLKKLDVRRFEKEITDTLLVFGAAVKRDAIQNVEDNRTTDEGGLVNSIGFKSERSLSVEIFAHKDYAAFIEFGTRKFAAAHVATLPPEWKAFAAQFKGSGGGGSFQDLVKAITGWVKRKGFAAQLTKSGNKSKSKSSQAGEDQAAYLIARSIMINGIRARPFLFPAVEKNLPILMRDLKDLLNA